MILQLKKTKEITAFHFHSCLMLCLSIITSGTPIEQLPKAEERKWNAEVSTVRGTGVEQWAGGRQDLVLELACVVVDAEMIKAILQLKKMKEIPLAKGHSAGNSDGRPYLAVCLKSQLHFTSTCS